MKHRLIEYTTILIAGLYITELALSGALAFYIHPRYFLFSTVAAIVMLTVGTLGVGLTILKIRKQKPVQQQHNLDIDHHHDGHHHAEVDFGILNVAMIVILLLGIALPARALTARSASQRASATNVVSVERPTAISQFVSNRDSYGIGEWIAEINRNPNVEKYVGQKVSLEGFVFVAEGQTGNEFTISKFVVRCCVVDATPVGLAVTYDWQSKFKQSDWVRVTGEFKAMTKNGQQVLIIEASNLEAIPTPNQPYIY
jgi:putative membrane protein